MRKISKRLCIAIAVVLCIGVVFIACLTPSDANEQKHGGGQNTMKKVSKQNEKSEEDSDNISHLVSNNSGKKSEKEGGYQEQKESKTTVISDNSNNLNSSKEATNKNTQSVPKHVHSWEPVYSIRTDYESVDVYGVRCNNCGYSTTVAADLYDHIDRDPFDRCGSYSTGVVIRSEQNEVKEQYISGYKCSCGAEK